MALTALIRGGGAMRRFAKEQLGNGKVGSGYEPQRHCLELIGKATEELG